MKNKIISQKLLSSLFKYDKESGILTRIRHISGSAKMGDTVGTKRVDGYLCVIIDGESYLLHRIIWILTTGEQPNTIDHINRNRGDNRWCNLRNVSPQENCYNQSLRSNNKSGIVGVSFDKRRNSWRSTIMVNAVQIFLGRFEDMEDAISARLEAEPIYGFHPNHCK